MNNNPYSWNTVKPYLCYGRDNLIVELLSGLPGTAKSSYGIAGGRRMGKSTLLRRVENDLRDDIQQWKTGGLFVIPVYVDGLSLPRPLTSECMWRDLCKNICKELDLNINGQETITDFASFKDTIFPILSSQSLRPRVIVIFDEIEPILVNDWGDGYFANWRALLSNTPGLDEYFSAVFSGAKEMAALQRDIGSPLKDILEWRNLRPLDFDDVCLLIQEPIDHEWPSEFQTKIYNLTGGHPMLTQYLMHHVCKYWPDQEFPSLEDLAKQFEETQGSQYSSWWNRYLSFDARRIYHRMPEDGSKIEKRLLTKEFGLQETNDALEILQHVGAVFECDDGFAYSYAGEMFRNWFRKNGIMEVETTHDPDIYSKLRSINESIADKYLSAWRIYANVDIPNYSGAVAEIRGVFEFIEREMVPSDESLMTFPGFKLEKGATRPTRRQKLRYMLKERYSPEKIVEVISDYELFELTCERIANSASLAYRSTSSLVHEVASRDTAYRTLKQWDAILAQIL